MRQDLQRYKPGVKTGTHLLLSAFLWTAVGSLMLCRGGLLLTDQGSWLVLLVVGLFAGSLKSRYILDPVARQAVERIRTFRDGTCLGAVYSVKTWLLVLCMAAAGGILRSLSLPVELLLFLYLMVGWGLLCSSRLAWRAWLDGP